MTTTHHILRDDTMFGVCEAIGEDFGFNPLWLRLILAIPVAFVPFHAFAIYGALALAVLISRLIVRDRPVGAAAEVIALPTPRDADRVANPELALAA